jgi:23S rRNA (pseudouridine1915-N3)-methyltransferase
MKVKIVTVAGKKNQFHEEIDRYIKMLPSFVKVELITLPISKRSKQQNVLMNIKEESNKILNLIDRSDYLVAMDEKGKQIDTIQFSQWLRKWMNEGTQPVFVIGGPDGLDLSIKDSAKVNLSLSSMTYPHSMVPLILIEQLYRAWSILDGQPYHRS